VQYATSRQSASQQGALHPYLGRFEDAVLEGQAAARCALSLRDQGFQPDVIVSHAGFGSGLYLKDVFPKARRIGLFEWYYTTDPGSDVHFLYGGQVPLDRAMRLRSWCAHSLLELAMCDQAVVPTEFQRSQFPEPWRSKLEVIHEGIDTNFLSSLRRDPPPRPACLPRDPAIEVVTHVARGFELYRGFPQAMAALALLQQRRPAAHVLIAGSDAVCYGGQATSPSGLSWGEWARLEAGLDPARTHWLGPIQSDAYHALLAHAQAHLYLTIPFVLSWSLLEAMASGCPIVASATAPVQEVITEGVEGLLCEFHDVEALASGLEACLSSQELGHRLGRAAQQRALSYDCNIGLAGWGRLLHIPL
jgi:glycosyltransferase involved in cell wall biosynthesis